MRRRIGLIVLALGLFSAAANAIPTGTITSGNGMLSFSNFQFFSPFNTVNASDVTITGLTDGLQFSGNVGTSTDVKSFYVAYEINLTPAAAGQGIKRASMQLASSVDSDTLGLVLATKRLIGDKTTGNFFGKSDANAKGTRALSPGTDAFNDSTSKFLGFNGFSRKTVAFLKTADWMTADTGFKPPLGLGGDGAIRMVEAGFANQTHLRVLEHVVVAADSGTATWTGITEHFTTGAGSPVPEPGTAALMLLGFSVVAIRRRRTH